MRLNYIGSTYIDGNVRVGDPEAVKINRDFFYLKMKGAYTDVTIEPGMYDAFTSFLEAQGEFVSTHLIFIPHLYEKPKFAPSDAVVVANDVVTTSFGYAVCAASISEWGRPKHSFFGLVDDSYYLVASLLPHSEIFDNGELEALMKHGDRCISGDELMRLCQSCPDLRLDDIISNHWSRDVILRANNPVQATVIYGGACALTDASYSNVTKMRISGFGEVLLASLYPYTPDEENGLIEQIMRCVGCF